MALPLSVALHSLARAEKAHLLLRRILYCLPYRCHQRPRLVAIFLRDVAPDRR